MEIESPRQFGFYAERAGDCEDALAPAFDEFVANGKLQFFDLKRILDAIKPNAVAAGWSCNEIIEAIHGLALDHQSRQATVQMRVA